MASHSARITRNTRLVDVAIAVGAFGASLLELALGTDLADHHSHLNVLSVLLAGLASLPLVARRYAPVWVFVVTALTSAVLMGVGEPVGPPVGPTLALYWLAAAGTQRARVTLPLAGVILVAHAAASGLATENFPIVELGFGVLVWGGAWLAGDRTRLRRERLAELEARALRAEREAERERRLAAAEERARIARDLHDSAGHAINVILVHAGLGRLRVDSDAASAREEFAIIEQVARETMGEIDQLVGALREDAGPGESEEVEPPAGLAALGGLVERHRAAGLDVTTTVDGDRRPVSPGVDRGAYRILQEALTNAARHGDGGARVHVTFGPGALEFSVANPVGPDRGAHNGGGGGHGLIGMRERAALLGGSLEAGSQGQQFRVRARLPLVDDGE